MRDAVEPLLIRSLDAPAVRRRLEGFRPWRRGRMGLTASASFAAEPRHELPPRCLGSSHPWQRLLRQRCASASRAFRAQRPGRHDPASPARLDPADPTRFWSLARQAKSDASLEVLSSSAFSGHAALSQAAGLERSRFGVHISLWPLPLGLQAWPQIGRSPLRFSAGHSAREIYQSRCFRMPPVPAADHRYGRSRPPELAWPDRDLISRRRS